MPCVVCHPEERSDEGPCVYPSARDLRVPHICPMLADVGNHQPPILDSLPATCRVRAPAGCPTSARCWQMWETTNPQSLTLSRPRAVSGHQPGAPHLPGFGRCGRPPTLPLTLSRPGTVSGHEFTACGKRNTWLARISILRPGFACSAPPSPNRQSTVSGHEFTRAEKRLKRTGLQPLNRPAPGAP